VQAAAVKTALNVTWLALAASAGSAALEVAGALAGWLSGATLGAMLAASGRITPLGLNPLFVGAPHSARFFLLGLRLPFAARWAGVGHEIGHP
jgi:hypothetical protein